MASPLNPAADVLGFLPANIHAPTHKLAKERAQPAQTINPNCNQESVANSVDPLLWGIIYMSR
jgi:hypothetical protein